MFCYTPLAGTDGWDVISIIPNDVVMEQANAIINATLLLCLVIVVGLGVVLAVYWRSSRAHRLEIGRMAFYDGLTGLYSADKFRLEVYKRQEHRGVCRGGRRVPCPAPHEVRDGPAPCARCRAEGGHLGSSTACGWPWHGRAALSVSLSP